jgi:hypothetical protein
MGGQKGQTRGPASAREADVRQDVKDEVSRFFTDLWQLNGDRPRGTPSKEYKDGWRNYTQISTFDCEPTKDTGESDHIRHRDQVLGLLEQVIRDREYP